MISFSKIGNMGRLGNQLFQYAFLRTQAERLGVTFYCPHWIGDEIFNLNDSKIKAEKPSGIINTYEEPLKWGYDGDISKIQDNSEIMGYFLSEDNFDKYKVREWYSFREDKFAQVKIKYKHINFSKSVGIHLRLGDKNSNKLFKNIYFIPRIKYYIKSLKMLHDYESILVFSDEINFAKKYFKRSKLNYIFIENNKDWEDLYLMAQCKNFICGASTMSWWGAWLIPHTNKIIFFPKEGIHRPWGPFKNKNLIPDDWIKVRALIPLWDSYFRVAFPLYSAIVYIDFKVIMGKIGILIKKFTPIIYTLLKPYFPDKK